MEVLISTYATLEVSIRCSAREMRAVGVSRGCNAMQLLRGAQQHCGRVGHPQQGVGGVHSRGAVKPCCSRSQLSRQALSASRPSAALYFTTASHSANSQEVFYHAIRAVLYPKSPLLEACE